MPLRIAVVGGGTTGFMAAVHLSRHFPQAELVQLIDPRIPTIGVGEGTTPGFWAWLDHIAGMSFEGLRQDLRVTKKRGVRFENWGSSGKVFDHAFVPVDAIGLHLSATQLVVFLRRYVRGDIVEAHVSHIDGGDDGAVVRIEDGSQIHVDVAIDARGFPPTLDDNHINLTWIPTSAALVTRTPVVSSLEWTRAVARPHGWIFVIPLSGDTAYGYIFGTDTASNDDVKSDFESFLASDGIAQYAEPKNIRFPNFLCKVPFRGRVLRIGNAASFIEPLEATSIAITRYELNFLTAWLRAFEALRGGRAAGHLVEAINKEIVKLVLEVSLFIGWHYAEGSTFDTPFWRGARGRFRQGLRDSIPPEIRARFFDQLAHASRVPVGRLAEIACAADLDRVLPEHRMFPEPFGGMTPLGFAQVGRGIGARSFEVS